jgi:hypothetical protein
MMMMMVKVVVQRQMVAQLMHFDKIILAVDLQHRVNVVIERETNRVGCCHDMKSVDCIEERSLFVRMGVGRGAVGRN